MRFLQASLPALLAFALAGAQAPPPAAADRTELGETLPSFTLPDLQGRPVSLAAFRGRPVVVFFLRGSWCSHCVELLVELQELRKGDLAGFPVLVLTAEPPEQIRQLTDRIARDRGVRLSHLFLFDRGLRFGARYRLTAQVPPRGWPSYLLLLDRDGRIVWSWSEAHDAVRPVTPALLPAVRALLKR